MTEYSGDSHQCYDVVDIEYVQSETFAEFFVQCSLCAYQEALMALAKSVQDGKNEWRRMKNSSRWRGYICKNCTKRLSLK